MKWDSGFYDRKHSFVTRYGEGVLALLAPMPGERILDVGCGTGHLTQMISRSGAIVTGIDSSVEMIATAHASYPEVEFVVADAANFTFERPFDAIFSNAALHWVHEAEAAVRCMAQALRPGGRFVVEFGGKGNVRRIYSTLEQVVRERTGLTLSAENYFPSIGEYSPLLERHGLQVQRAELFDRFTRLEDGPDGLRNWIRMFRRTVMEQVPEEQAGAILDEVEARTREALFKDGAWHADYRRLRIVAHKE